MTPAPTRASNANSPPPADARSRHGSIPVAAPIPCEAGNPRVSPVDTSPARSLNRAGQLPRPAGRGPFLPGSGLPTAAPSAATLTASGDGPQTAGKARCSFAYSGSRYGLPAAAPLTECATFTRQGAAA